MFAEVLTMCESMKSHQCPRWPHSCPICLRADKADGLAYRAVVRMIAAAKAGKWAMAERFRRHSEALGRAAVRC
jgi:hypothetical protein